MKTFNRASLPDAIKYNGKSYFLDIDKTTKKTLAVSFDAKSCVLVNVMHKNLKGKTDFYGMPYKPSQFIFSTN